MIAPPATTVRLKRLRLGLGLTSLLAVAAAHGAPDGQELYRQHCAACHGDIGKGGVGIPLALPALLNTVPDSYLVETIRRGRPGRIMPAFPELSDAQVDAIVHHLRSWSGSKPTPLPETPVIGDVARGKILFQKHCASCHGSNGEGAHGTGVTLSRKRDYPVMPPALNNSGFLAASSAQLIRQTLREGRPGTPMVSFLKHGLSEQDIDDIVVYVRSFEKHPIARLLPAAGQQPTLVYESPYDFEQTVKNVRQAIAGRNYLVFPDRYLEQGLAPDSEVNHRQVTLRFCNFNELYKLINIDPRLSILLPCRITVMERKDGKVILVAMNLSRMMELFNNNELTKAFADMRDHYVEIMEEATL